VILLRQGFAGLALGVAGVMLIAACSPKAAAPPAAPAAPGAPAPPTPNGGDVTIGMGPDGTYTINGKPTRARTLEEALKEAGVGAAPGDKAAGGGK
jgi:hypothetical protein